MRTSGTFVMTQICDSCLDKQPRWTKGDVIGLAYCEHCWSYTTVFTGYRQELNSLPRKDQESITQGSPARWMYVAELKNLLEELDDSDKVSPNAVGNLCITTSDGVMKGTVNFRFTTIEWAYAVDPQGGEKTTPVP